MYESLNDEESQLLIDLDYEYKRPHASRDYKMVGKIIYRLDELCVAYDLPQGVAEGNNKSCWRNTLEWMKYFCGCFFT